MCITRNVCFVNCYLCLLTPGCAFWLVARSNAPELWGKEALRPQEATPEVKEKVVGLLQTTVQGESVDGRSAGRPEGGAGALHAGQRFLTRHACAHADMDHALTHFRSHVSTSTVPSRGEPGREVARAGRRVLRHGTIPTQTHNCA